MKVNYYTKCNNPSQTTEMEVTEIFNLIKHSDQLKKHCEYLRKEQDKELRRSYKAKYLPAITPAGLFYYRAANKLKLASGLAGLDFDDCDGEKLKEKIKNDPYVYASFVSPSGSLKVVVRIPVVKNDEEYKLYYETLIIYFKKFGVNPDTANKDISRLCFLSYDPEIYINESSNVFTTKATIQKKEEKIKTETTTNEELKNIINSDYRIKELLFKDGTKKFESRSHAEQSLVNLLVFKGIFDYDVINNLMQNSKTGKWNEKGENYRKLTFKKALEIYKENQNKKTKGQQERDTRIKTLLSKPKRDYKSLGVGIHNEVYYIGTTITENNKKLNAVVTSDKNIYVCWFGYDDKGKQIINNEIKKDFGLNYRFDLFDDCIDYSWSNSSIQRWLYEDVKNISIKEVYEQILRINKGRVYHTDKRTHTYIACDIISNYFYQIFNAKGRTYFQAEFESGKSRQSRIYHLLSFNPLFASNISPASFERVIESTGGTIIIDNFDNMPDDLKKLILQAIEVYYKKGGKNIKADGTSHKPIAFNGYSPIVINNIIGLNEVTESRCNKILMLRSNDKSITDTPINEKDKFWGKLRDKLHICVMQNWEEVRDKYETLKINDLSARDLERAEAVLTIAKCISDDVFNELLGFIKERNEQQSIKELSTSWEFILFEHLNKVLKEDGKIKINDITEAVKEKITDLNNYQKCREDKLKFSHYAGKVLSSIPNFKKSISMGYVKYEIKKSDLDKIIQIKGFDKYLLSEGDNPTNPTNPTNPPNTTNTTINNKKEEKNSSVSKVSRVKGGSRVLVEEVIETPKQRVLSEIPSGKPIDTQGLLNSLKDMGEEVLIPILENLSKKGDIYSPKPDYWVKL